MEACHGFEQMGCKGCGASQGLYTADYLCQWQAQGVRCEAALGVKDKRAAEGH